MSCHNIRPAALAGYAALALVAGCNQTATEPRQAPVESRSSATTGVPASRTEPGRDVIPPSRQENPKFSFDTENDRRFADFLREKSAGMVRQAAVGVDRAGKLRIQLDRSVSPDETLPLTKSILAGAHKDFPGKAFVLSIYDPQGEPVLRARVNAEGSTRYEVVHDEGGGGGGGTRTASGGGQVGLDSADPLARSGRTEADRKFAAWAEDHGRSYLRYVQADLERNGRLWFGVTREVKPADVPDLTKSLLEGAHREFPRQEILATVFDPSGERIGRAHLGSGGQVRWEQ